MKTTFYFDAVFEDILSLSIYLIIKIGISTHLMHVPDFLSWTCPVNEANTKFACKFKRQYRWMSVLH